MLRILCSAVDVSEFGSEIITRARMAQWIRRLPTEQEIPGSSPGMAVLATQKQNQKTLHPVRIELTPTKLTRTWVWRLNHSATDAIRKRIQQTNLPKENKKNKKMQQNRFYRDLNPDYKDQNLGVLTNYTIEPFMSELCNRTKHQKKLFEARIELATSSVLDWRDNQLHHPNFLKQTAQSEDWTRDLLRVKQTS